MSSDATPTDQILVGENPRLPPPGHRRILVLKLDHLGDFIIGRPALEALRQAFPRDYIRLVCSSWNLATAQESGVADEIGVYDFFPQVTSHWDGRPAQDVSVFDAAAAGSFDIAIDLRVDPDTRHLLRRVDAKLRCGVDAGDGFDFLDVSLPVESKIPGGLHDKPGRGLSIPLDNFSSRMHPKDPLYHELKLRRVNECIIYGPYIELQPGKYEAIFGLRAFGPPAWPRAKLVVDVANEGEVLASKAVDVGSIRGKSPNSPIIKFEVNKTGGRYEFRVHANFRSYRNLLQFSGLTLNNEFVEKGARLNAAKMHIGETLSLLVELLVQRVDTQGRKNSSISKIQLDLQGVNSAKKKIFICPVSNKSLRDWPLRNYTMLIGAILERTDALIYLVGTADQKTQLDLIASSHHNDKRIINLCGNTKWSELGALLKSADLVICNNSGVAHLAADLGRPTLAIYSASHPPVEWGPRGPNVRTLMGRVACSPCGFDRLEDCTNDYRCMTMITPEIVTPHVLEMLDLEDGRLKRMQAAPT